GGYVWDPVHGARSLSELLSDLGIDLTGWPDLWPAAISADGLTIAGRAYYPSGQEDAWVATIPEPNVLPLLVLPGILAARRRILSPRALALCPVQASGQFQCSAL